LGPAEASAYKYKAFISYSHRDEKWARWLHRALETYRVPRHLVGQQTSMGVIPVRPSPVFRDRDELPSATDLGAKLREALEGSACQIVICSPASAASHWVNEEILSFKRLGRAERIFALIVGGEPYASGMPGRESEECFPPALRYQLDLDGKLSDVPAEPIAADARPGKDGKSNAQIKLLAGMLGVGFDALRQRELQRRQRRLVMLTSAALTGMVVAIGLATSAVIARNEAQLQRERAEKEAETARKTSAFMVGLFKVADPSQARGQITAVELLQVGARRIDTELKGQPGVQATLMDTIGTVYTGLGLYNDAHTMLERALAQRRALAPVDPREIARSQVHLAQVLTEKAELEAAERLFNEAIAVLQGSASEFVSADELAAALAGLAEVYFRAGRYPEAEPLLARVYEIRRARLPPGDPAIADALEELGLNQFDQGNYERAEIYLRDALAMRRVSLGDAPHPDVAENLNNLALLLMESSRFEESERLFQEAMTMNSALYGAVHPDVAAGLNNLGLLYRSQGDLAKAEESYSNALGMQRQLRGEKHPEVARVQSNLAFVYYDEGQLARAIDTMREAMEMQRATSGPRHPDTANSMSALGRWLSEAGKDAEAAVLLRQALALLTELHGADHPDVAIAELGLAQTLARTGPLDEALAMAKSAAAKVDEAFGPEHWIAAVAGSTEGSVLAAMGRPAEAEPLLKQGYEALRDNPSARPAYLRRARESLVAFYEESGRKDLALTYRQEASAVAPGS
jgi:tetratricopeptide (TPR) repeat protein